ncbi:hypothetical protein CsSME_00012196 [Camellia sinensis var. sinensis]
MFAAKNIMERSISLRHEIGKFWNAWDIQIFVLLSLSLQGFLVLSASYRKHAVKKWVVTLISLAYFLADWVTPYGLGLISSRQQITTVTANLYAFWAPFLLLHLSGPDNISSLTLDENEGTTKQSVQLISQTIAIFFILQRSFQPNDTHIILSAALVFGAGSFKYAERIVARKFARQNKRKNSSVPTTPIEPNPGPDYEKLSGAHLAMREAHLPMEVRSFQMPPKKFKASSECDHHLPNEEGDKSLLKFAHFFFRNFKGFMGGTSFSPKQRQFTRHFFLRKSAHDAFKILEMELSIIHDALHTKAVAAQGKIGSILRVFSASSILVASLLFFLHDKRRFLKIDVIITYVLIVGAIVLEILSLLMLRLSDWYLIAYKQYNWAKCIAAAIVNKRRWSESVSKFNIISYSLHKNPTVNSKLPGAQQFMGNLSFFRIIQTTTSDSAPKSVRYKIFEELKMKSEKAENVETATKICSQRGDWALMQSCCYRQFKWSLGEIEYRKSLVLWHIATDLCLYSCRSSRDYYDLSEFCKTISDYMLYLLMMKPTMTVPVAGCWLQVFWDTSAEAKRLFHKRSIRDHREACKAILSVDTEFEPVVLKGDASESVLFDACRLAKQLMEKKEPWKLMSKVWIELLGYAAVNCEANVHAQQLSQGEELLTFVWLMMNHLGLGMQFRDEPAWTRYKVVVKK